MKNIFLKIITCIMLVTVLNANFAVANVLSPAPGFEDAYKKIKQEQEAAENRRLIFISDVFIFGASILIILSGIFALIYIKTRKNKSDSSDDTES